MRAVAFLFAFALAGASPQAQGKVIVVDKLGGGAFTSLEQAVKFGAAPGDTVLVRTGSYVSGLIPWTIDKGITLQADTGASVTVESLTRVTALPAGRVLTVRGIDFKVGLEVEGNDGTVWLEDCTTVQHNARVLDSSAVVITRCFFEGRDFDLFCYPAAFAGESALDVVRSDVHVYGSELRGGNGAPGCSKMQPGWPGGAGARVEDGILVGGGNLFVGGDGGNAVASVAAQGGDGGAGLWLATAASAAWAVDCGFQGGAGGPGSLFGGMDGSRGVPVLDPFGAFAELAGEVLLLDAASPARDGTQVDLAVSATPGTAAFLGIGPDPLALFVATLSGTVAVGPPYLVLALGTIPATGTLAVALGLGGLPPGVESLVFYGQGAALAPSGAIVLGQPSAVVLLDAAF